MVVQTFLKRIGLECNSTVSIAETFFEKFESYL